MEHGRDCSNAVAHSKVAQEQGSTLGASGSHWHERYERHVEGKSIKDHEAVLGDKYAGWSCRAATAVAKSEGLHGHHFRGQELKTKFGPVFGRRTGFAQAPALVAGNSTAVL